MRVMLRVRAALHIRKVLLILALKRSFESLRSAIYASVQALIHDGVAEIAFRPRVQTN